MFIIIQKKILKKRGLKKLKNFTVFMVFSSSKKNQIYFFWKKSLIFILIFNLFLIIIREGYVFNGKILNLNLPLNKIIKNLWGLNNCYLHSLLKRLEIYNDINIKNVHSSCWFTSANYLIKTVPNRSSLKRRFLLNLIVLDAITSYRGWRHYKGLPVRGQRTWSNSSTSYRSNAVLRNYKIKMARSFYGNLPTNEISLALSAEQVNLHWKIQFFDEWLSAKRSRLNYRGAPNTIKIDFYSMANGQIMNPIKFAKMTKKQRQSFKKNHFSLGFDPGFTKTLLRELYKARTDPTYKSDIQSKLLFRRVDIKKKKVKKKVDLRAKIIAHETKKKKKKTVWDL